jgi:hypothetical protein
MTTTLRADQQPRQNGLTDWGYLPDQWRLVIFSPTDL